MDSPDWVKLSILEEVISVLKAVLEWIEELTLLDWIIISIITSVVVANIFVVLYHLGYI